MSRLKALAARIGDAHLRVMTRIACAIDGHVYIRSTGQRCAFCDKPKGQRR